MLKYERRKQVIVYTCTHVYVKNIMTFISVEMENIKRYFRSRCRIVKADYAVVWLCYFSKVSISNDKYKTRIPTNILFVLIRTVLFHIYCSSLDTDYR